jgi:transcriptional regulator with XRE-family HTH domain
MTYHIRMDMNSGGLPGGELVKEARLRSGLSQHALARRLGTSQPVIARWESGRRSPSVDALVRAVRACGLDVSMSIGTYDTEHELLIRQNLRLTPGERLDRMIESRRGIDDLVKSARRK